MEETEKLRNSFLDGCVLLFDKPYQWTSFDVVNKLKALLRHQLEIKKIKIGHAGTLDPLATGLLIVCTGKMTKSIHKFQDMDKEYNGIFYIGATTPSFDLETSPDKEYSISHITKEEIEETAKQFTGSIEQLPPLFSAKKIDGKRAYSYARKGKSDTPTKSNTVHIYDFSITNTNLPYVNFNVVCSKGTYIRSLAHDFGVALNSGAYLKNLRRVRIGTYHVNDAWDINDFEKSIKYK